MLTVEPIIELIGNLSDALFIEEVDPPSFVDKWPSKNAHRIFKATKQKFSDAQYTSYHSFSGFHFVNKWIFDPKPKKNGLLEGHVDVYEIPDSHKYFPVWIARFELNLKGSLRDKYGCIDKSAIKGRLGNLIDPECYGYNKFSMRWYKTTLAKNFFIKTGESGLYGETQKIKSLGNEADRLERKLKKKPKSSEEVVDLLADLEAVKKRKQKAKRKLRKKIKKLKKATTVKLKVSDQKTITAFRIPEGSSQRKKCIKALKKLLNLQPFKPSWRVHLCEHYFISVRSPRFIDSLLNGNEKKEPRILGYQPIWFSISKDKLTEKAEKDSFTRDLLEIHKSWNGVTVEQAVRRVFRTALKRAVEKHLVRKAGNKKATALYKLHEYGTSLVPDGHAVVPFFQFEGEDLKLKEEDELAKIANLIGKQVSSEMIRFFKFALRNPVWLTEETCELESRENWLRNLKISWKSSQGKECECLIEVVPSNPRWLLWGNLKNVLRYMNRRTACFTSKAENRSGIIKVTIERKGYPVTYVDMKPHEFLRWVLGSERNKNSSLKNLRTGAYEKGITKASKKAFEAYVVKLGKVVHKGMQFHGPESIEG